MHVQMLQIAYCTREVFSKDLNNLTYFRILTLFFLYYPIISLIISYVGTYVFVIAYFMQLMTLSHAVKNLKNRRENRKSVGLMIAIAI